ncbi:CHASE2 domain-containing protein [Chelatococcus sp. GCM10030263]|uniref:CHASE2 domain-containing protein n=1 Tax=Chelatococcus sp. GCM10030263 TaxID=3273387 RepID=UPI00360ED4DC
MPRGDGARPLTLAAILLALVWSAYVAHWQVAGRASALDRLEAVALDLRAVFAPRRPPPADLVIIAIDDETVRQAGRYPLPRDVMATLVAAISAQKPRALALDILFADPGPRDQDAALARALQETPAVIAAAGLFGEGRDMRTEGAVSRVPQPRQLLWPVEPMATAADVGLVNVATDYGGIPRHAPLLFRGSSGLIPSFVLLGAALATGAEPQLTGEALRLGARSIPLDLGQHLALRYYGPRGTIPTISAARLLAAPAAGQAAPDLAGKTIVIGATAVGSGDSFPTPFSAVVPGVEVLATAIGNLVAGDALTRTAISRWLDAGAAGILALAAIGLISMRRVATGLLLVGLLAVAWVGLSFVGYILGYWVSTTVPLAAMLPVAAVYGAARLWLERRKVRHLTGVEERLLPLQPRPIAISLSEDPNFLAAPVAQDAAILFVDLAGYTGLSEALGAERTRELLKGFQKLVDAVVNAHGGFVVTFMGDGAMGLFGFPDPEDGALRALRALDELDRRLRDDWAGESLMEHAPRPRARLSAHYGPVVVSRLGGESHQQVTATGDTVNVASRLLEVAKAQGATVVVSESILHAAGEGALLARYSPPMEVPIRGRTAPVAVRIAAARD